MLVGVETSIGGDTGGKKAAHHIIQPRSIRVVIVIYSGLDRLACSHRGTKLKVRVTSIVGCHGCLFAWR
jgi:hypothetical protein